MVWGVSTDRLPNDKRLLGSEFHFYVCIFHGKTSLHGQKYIGF